MANSLFKIQRSSRSYHSHQYGGLVLVITKLQRYR
uniref:Uncharacterized protein n=1 Tax=Myoviridae sp. ctrMq22 TaxID=2825181 RepID=A0A8S5NVQ6_9CAUD|nr:MAG TPA: hypothetical protein [Myoviridae sp. ctrMq22]